MNELTLQEQYDKMASHVSSMKMQSSEGMSCAYKTRDGRRCAVGILIPDDHPEALRFLGDVKELLKRFPELGDRIDEQLGRKFQEYHDIAANWKDRTSQRYSYQKIGSGGILRRQSTFNKIAKEFKLTPYRVEKK
jgi:hypothetical protein